MRHRKHRHTLGVKKEHRAALMANLAAALFRHGRIETTLAKARALRPFAEKIVTLAVKADKASDPAKKVHYLRMAIARVRDTEAVFQLFNERVAEFKDRPGGYTRIYKLVPRVGDAANMALIELINASDEGYSKPKSRSGKARKKAVAARAESAQAEQTETADTAMTAAAEAPESAEGTDTPTEPKAEATPSDTSASEEAPKKE
ncbi:MAG: 50S ribosomal protein L17 [Opitutales bacterium]